MTMEQFENRAAARPAFPVVDLWLRALMGAAMRLFSRVGLAVAAGRFSSSSGGIGPWQC